MPETDVDLITVSPQARFISDVLQVDYKEINLANPTDIALSRKFIDKALEVGIKSRTHQGIVKEVYGLESGSRQSISDVAWASKKSTQSVRSIVRLSLGALRDPYFTEFFSLFCSQSKDVSSELATMTNFLEELRWSEGEMLPEMYN